MLQTSNFSIVHKLPHYMDIAYQDFDDFALEVVKPFSSNSMKNLVDQWRNKFFWKAKHFEQKYIQSLAYSWFNNLTHITLYT